MARKLMKHEIINSWIEITVVCLGIICFSLLFSLFSKLRIQSPTLVGFSILALVFLYFAAGVLMIINIVRSFNKKIFSDEGYLTLTLPVTVDQLIISKIVVNIIWIIMTIITYLVSFMVIASALVSENIIFPIIGELFEFLTNYPLLSILNIYGILVGILSMIVTLIFVLSFLNMGKVKKFKLLIGVILYYIIWAGINFMSNLIRLLPFVLTYDYSEHSYQFVHHSELTGNVLSLILNSGGYFDFNSLLYNMIAIVVFYLLSRHNIKYKIELE